MSDETRSLYDAFRAREISGRALGCICEALGLEGDWDARDVWKRAGSNVTVGAALRSVTADLLRSRTNYGAKTQAEVVEFLHLGGPSVPPAIAGTRLGRYLSQLGDA